MGCRIHNEGKLGGQMGVALLTAKLDRYHYKARTKARNVGKIHPKKLIIQNTNVPFDLFSFKLPSSMVFQSGVMLICSYP